jgi:hypothetical protein
MSEKKTIQVKTFTKDLKIFATMRELAALDEEVNRFIKEEKIKKVVSVSDTTTADITGATMGLIRVVAYET